MTITIVKPATTNNYTILPNFLLNYGRTGMKLRSREISILLYLLSRPKTGWKFSIKDVAAAVGVCVNTAYAGLKILQREGLMWYRRDRYGHTFWHLEIPDEYQEKLAISPYTKKPCVENCDELVITEKSVIKKTTTGTIKPPPVKIDETVVVPVSVIDVNESVPVVVDDTKVSLVDSLDLPDVHKLAVKKSLQKSKIDPVIQEYILIALKTALTSGSVRNPIAYLNGLVNKALSGTFDTSAFKQEVKPVPREQFLKSLFEKHGEKIKQDIAKNGFINSEIGFIQFDEIRKLGLIEQSYVELFNKYRLMDISKKSSTSNKSRSKNQIINAKKSNTPLTPELFEKFRQEKIRLAMEMINEGKS